MYSIKLLCDGIKPDGKLSRMRDENCGSYRRCNEVPTAYSSFVGTGSREARNSARDAGWKEVEGGPGKPTRWYCRHCADRFEYDGSVDYRSIPRRQYCKPCKDEVLERQLLARRKPIQCR